MIITSNFDAGNIEVLSITNNNIDLNIRLDTNSHFFQWFYFKADLTKGETYTFRILNAKDSAFPDGWENYRTNTSYNNKDWFRIDTSYEEGILSFEITAKENQVYFSYTEPFSYLQHQNLIQNSILSDFAKLEVLGKTNKNRDIDLLIIGEASKTKKNIWFTARQHPGESMAEWFIQGLIERLLNPKDEISKALLNKYCFYIIPNLNVDGSISGNLRVNDLGINYNREWDNPSMEQSPDIFYCLEKMDAVGVDFLMDVHGDEAIPYNFVTSLMGIPSLKEDTIRKENIFKDNWMAISKDFQDTYRYENSAPGEANLKVCSKQIGERFGCLSFTLEMPFKDNDGQANPSEGWSGKRSMNLGKSVLETLLKSEI